MNTKKITKNGTKSTRIVLKTNQLLPNLFSSFLLTKRSQGAVEVTLRTYAQHFKSISKHLDTQIDIDDLTAKALQDMINSMRAAALSPNTIKSYTITFRAFLSWCRDEGYEVPKLQKYKGVDVIKDIYTDDELKLLLQKPNLRKCAFPEYRTWVIINLLVNCGCRASTIRMILICDLDLSNNIIHARHTKNKKALVIPLCQEMILILKDYLSVRGGGDDDYLFCDEYGGMLSENALRCAVKRYNRKRGIQKTSIHLFRHTFAKKYLLDCGGNAFTLQKLLGHSTLDMTRHYCEIFNSEIAKDYDKFSPLAQINSKNKKLKMKN